MAKCNQCGADIIWLPSKSGKNVPVNAKTVQEEDLVYDPALGHTNHIASCRARYAKRKRRESSV